MGRAKWLWTFLCIAIVSLFFLIAFHSKQFIGKGDINKKFYSSLPEGGGYTRLHLASRRMDFIEVKLLLEKGADPNICDDRGRSPLHSMVESDEDVRFGRCADLLVQYGANPNLADKNGNTPLHLAAKIRNPLKIRELLRVGASINAINRSGRTPLHMACMSAVPYSTDLDVIQLLVESGADLNAEALNSEKPVDSAVKANRDDLVRELDRLRCLVPSEKSHPVQKR